MGITYIPVTGRNDDEFIAQHVFGWKWISYIGTPIRGTEGYPCKCRVRQFFSPKTLENKDWIEYFAEAKAQPATGDEPLSYSYCSSAAPEMVPPYTSDRNADWEVWQHVKKNWSKEGLEEFKSKLNDKYMMSTRCPFSRAVLKCIKV